MKNIQLLFLGSLILLNHPSLAADSPSPTEDPNYKAGYQALADQCNHSTDNPICKNIYNQGLTAGMAQCRQTPAACGISVDQNLDGSTQAGVEQCRKSPFSCGIALGAEDGIKQCQQDPAACGIAVNTDGSTQAGIQQCQQDPASCGIDVTQKGIAQCQKDPASCGIDVHQNNDGATQDGIAFCQNDPTSCGINTNTDGSTQEGIAQCQREPATCGIPVNVTVQDILSQCQKHPASCGIQVNACSAPPLPGLTPVHGIYSPLEGKLYFPAVDVPSLFDATITAYQVEMQLIPGSNPLAFLLISAVPLGE